MSALLGGGSSGTSTATAVPTGSSVMPINQGGSQDPNWLAQLQKLGYTPNGQTSWGQIGSVQPNSLIATLQKNGATTS